MPVSPSDKLSLFWAADWWSRWQKATPGIVPETTEDLLKVLISAFWRGDITDEQSPERLRISRLEVLRNLCDRAKREFEGADIRTLSAFGFYIPTPKGRSTRWTDDSCNAAFLYMAEHWVMMVECVEGFNTAPGVDPKLRAITARLKHLPSVLEGFLGGADLSRDQFLGLIRKRGYQRPTFWDGEEKPVEETARDADLVAELGWGKKPTVLKKGAHLTVVRSNDNPIPPAGSETSNLTRRKRGQKRSEKSIEAERRLEAAVNSDPALLARLNTLPEKELAKLCACHPETERHHIRTARDSVLKKHATK